MKIFKTGLENYRFHQNSGNEAYGRGWGVGVILFTSLWRILYENRYVTRPLRMKDGECLLEFVLGVGTL